MIDTPQVDLGKLHELLLNLIGLDELQNFCVSLGVHRERVISPQANLPVAIDEVITYFKTSGQLGALIERAQRQFPDAAWASIVKAPSEIIASTANFDFVPAREGESLIIIADFDNRSKGTYTGFEPANYIYDQLRMQVKKDRLSIRIERLHRKLDEKTAPQIGENSRATLLVWGWYDSLSIRPVIERAKKATYTSSADIGRLSIADRDKVEPVITGDLPNQASYLILLTLGLEQLASGDLTEALRYFDTILTTVVLDRITTKNRSGVYYWRGAAYLQKGDHDRAIADYDQAIKLEPDLADAYINRGLAYDAKGEYDRAIADYDQAIKLEPDLADAYINRGLAYDAKGEYDRAIADYDQAIKLEPDLADAYINRGFAYGYKGEYDRAIADYTQVIQFEPEFAVAYINRGFAYRRKGDHDRAIADYDQAIKLEPDLADAYINRGAAYTDKGEYDRAIADYTQAIQFEPDLADAYINRGLAYTDKGDHDRAIADYTQAIKFEPNLAVAYINRGAAYGHKGKYDRAIADYTQVIQFEPEFAVAYINRGAAYDAKGDKEGATADYKKYLGLGTDPTLCALVTEALKS